MRNVHRAVRLAVMLIAIVGISGCVTGRYLRLQGKLERPAHQAREAQAAAAPEVAVLDFAYQGGPPYEIGRDYDHARTITWPGNPGKEMADLIAGVLREKGIGVARVPAAYAAPPGAARVWGTINRFHVDVRKPGSLRIDVESAASVAVTVHGVGGKAPAEWTSTVTSDYAMTDPVFVMPSGVRNAVNAAANAVAEEAVRRLIAAGVVTPASVPAGGATPGRP